VQIIDKFKDYYDYHCWDFGEPDKDRTYDRRGSRRLTQSELTFMAYDSTNRYWADGWRPIDKTFALLEVGFEKYLLEFSNFSRKSKFSGVDEKYLDSYYDNWTYDSDVRLVKKFVDYDRRFGKTPITLFLCVNREKPRGANYAWTWSKQNDVAAAEKIIELRVATVKETQFIENPILADTKIPGAVDGGEVYLALDNYFGAMHRDLPVESTNPDLTDVDKAVNHGFDKRESFRNIK
jgi:hypothetical protein